MGLLSLSELSGLGLSLQRCAERDPVAQAACERRNHAALKHWEDQLRPGPTSGGPVPIGRCVGGDGTTRCGTPRPIAVGEPHPSAPIMPPAPLSPSAEHEARMEALKLQRERLEVELKREELLRLRMRRPATASAPTPVPPRPVRLRRAESRPDPLLLFAAGVAISLLLSR